MSDFIMSSLCSFIEFGHLISLVLFFFSDFVEIRAPLQEILSCSSIYWPEELILIWKVTRERLWFGPLVMPNQLLSVFY